VSNAARRDAGAPAGRFEAIREPASLEPAPDEAATAREEQAIVWRALEEMPAPYREVLLLFYWEDRSVARVAEALGLGEDAVRQRLVRGRRMLKAEVEALIETGLRRARPGRAFAAAVVAALPGGTSQAAVGAGGVATAAAKTALGAGAAGAAAGAAVGVLGGLIGAWASIRATRSERERRYMIRVSVLSFVLSLGMAALVAAVVALAGAGFLPAPSRSPGWLALLAGLVLGETALVVWAVAHVNRRQRQIQIEEGTHLPSGPRSRREVRFLVLAAAGSLVYVAVFLAAGALLEHLFPERMGTAWGQLTKWSLYLVGLMQGIAWINRRQHAIRVAEGRAAPVPQPPPGAPTPEIGASPRVIYSSLAGGIVGGTLWMFPMCFLAGDWLVALVILAVGGVTLHASARAAIRRPDRYFRIAFWSGMVTSALVFGVVNLRYEAWMVFYRESRWYQPGGDWPLWAVDVALVALFAWLQLDMLRRDRRHRGR
jgi:hypothetical protein